MDSMPEEYAYFWRRLCVIACEDVGPADDVLASFVIACSTVFPPKKTAGANYRIICHLAEQMCDSAHAQSDLLQLWGNRTRGPSITDCPS
jgi:replication-associated recombination protein RarA